VLPDVHLRPIAGTGRVGELELLSPDECAQVAATVLALRPAWTTRSPQSHFFTLGVNAYMDLAPAQDAVAGYHGRVAEANDLLRQHFSALFDTLSAGLTRALGRPARYADDLALPGFHIWTAPGIPRAAGGSLHFDLQYLKLLDVPAYAGATGTVSFTLPIRLPAAGSSLRVWPDLRYPEDSARLAAARHREPRVIEYTVGRALVHSGHVLHQIGTTPTVQPDDLRIMLQGHGLLVGDDTVLYW